MGMQVAIRVRVMVLASLSFRAQPHKRSEVLSAIDDTADRMRRAPGCQRCRLLVDNDDANAFTLSSEWQSMPEAEAFVASREFQVLKGMRILLREEPAMVFDEICSRVTRVIHAR
jgi:quinol monooxygenase YgiN